MNRRLKLFAVIAGVPVMLVLLAALILPAIVDSSFSKDKLIALVRSHTGRDFHIDGEVRLRMLPRLNLTVTEVRLESPAGFGATDLATLASLTVGVRPLPLLDGRIETDRVSVRGLAVHLERNQQGRGNWEGLTSIDKDSRDTQAGSLAAIAIAGLDVQQASLSWRDHSTGTDTQLTLSDIGIDAGALMEGRRIDDVRVTVTLPGANSAAVPAIVEVRGDVALASEGRALTVSNLQATVRDLSVAGVHMRGGLTAGLRADFSRQRLTLEALQGSLETSGDDDARATLEIATVLDFDFSEQRLAQSALSIMVPAYSVSGVGGRLALNGLLGGDLRAGRITLKTLRSHGTMGDDRHPDDRRAFRFIGDLEFAVREQMLSVKHLELIMANTQTKGALTLHAVQAPPGARGAFDLSVQGQQLKGSIAIVEADAGVDLQLDLRAEIDDDSFVLRGSNAIALSASVSSTPEKQGYRVADLQLSAQLADASARGGRLPVTLRADLDVDLDNESVHSDNLRLDLDNNRIAGSVDLRGFETPAVQFDLEADTIDADRLLGPVTASADDPAGTTPLSATIDAIRALDLNGEVRVQELTLRGLQLKNVRLSSRSGVTDG